ncbi:MAG TPA: hypothetical protein VGD14_07415 [bacterium]
MRQQIIRPQGQALWRLLHRDKPCGDYSTGHAPVDERLTAKKGIKKTKTPQGLSLREHD